jgi:hypothetical protein
VKSGKASVEPEEYEGFAETGCVFLHQSDTSSGTPEAVEYIERKELIEFLQQAENVAALPDSTILKLDILLT